MLTLGGSVSGDAKCVDVGFEQIAKGIVDHSVPVYPADPLECLRDYHNVKVALSLLRAFVANVKLTLILDR